MTSAKLLPEGLPPSAKLVSLSLLLLMLPASWSQDEQTFDQIILTSRCRAMCIGTFVLGSQSDAQCIANTNCYKCWGMCEKLLEPAWQYLCKEEQKHVCNDGCLHACDFMDKSGDEPIAAHDAELWDWPVLPTVSTESDTLLKVEWEMVQRADQRDDGAVYTLMWTYEDMDTWSPVCTTSELWADVEGPHYQYPGLDFILLAVTSGGVVAEASPVDLSTVPSVTTHHTSQGGAHTRQGGDHTAQGESHPPQEAPGPLFVKVDRVGTTLQGVVSWQLPEGWQPGMYQILWGRDDCDCEQPAGEDRNTLQLYMDQETSFDLPDLTYNSKYWVEIELSHGVASRVYFYTPRCDLPDPSCTLCQQTSKVFTALNTIHSDTDPLVKEPVSLFTVLGFCVVSAGVMIAMGALVTYKHKQLSAVMSAQTRALRRGAASFKSSFRSRANSLRTSVRSKMSHESSGSGGRRNRPHDIEICSPAGLVSRSPNSSPPSSPSNSGRLSPSSTSDIGSQSPSPPTRHDSLPTYVAALELPPLSTIEEEA